MSTRDLGKGVQWRWALPLGRAMILLVLVVTALVAAEPAHRLLVGGALLLCVVGSAYGLRYRPEQWRQRLVGLCGLAAGGILMVLVDSGAPGWLAGGVAIAASLVRLPQRPALLFSAGTAVGVILAPLIRHDTHAVPTMASICGAFAILGLVLAGIRGRALTAERLLASEQAASESAARAERYAERQRLAREIHDILAHTLSAQAIQLEGARLLLRQGSSGDDVRLHIETAQRLARDGLEETRRAVDSLRGEVRSLPETLRALADIAGATYRQEGEARVIPAQAALVIERTVQEALTNARKHAPGSSVVVTVRFAADHDEVDVRNTGATSGDLRVIAVGGGHGLVGMRERAALIGAALTTGPYPVDPDGKGYRVWLTIPRTASSGS